MKLGQPRPRRFRPSRRSAALLPVILFLLGVGVHEVAVLVRAVQDAEPGLHGTDFAVYYAAAWAVREGVLEVAYAAIPREVVGGLANPHLNQARLEGRRWSEIYDQHTPGMRVYPYIYPPTLAVVLVPLTFVPFPMAYGLFIALNLALVTVAVLLGIQLAGRKIALIHLAIALLTIQLFTPVYLSLFWGQVAGVLAACWAGAALLATRGRRIASGALVGFGAALKLTPALLLPFMLVRREWRWCVGFALGFGMSLVFSAFIVGGHTTIVGLWDVQVAQSCGLIHPQNASVTSATAQLLTDIRRDATLSPEPADNSWFAAGESGCAAAQSGVAVLLVLLLASVGSASRARVTPVAAQIAAVAVLSLSLSPVSWVHAYAQLLFPLSLFVASRKRCAWAGSVLWVLLVGMALGWPWQFLLLDAIGPGALLTSVVLLSALVPLGLYFQLQFRFPSGAVQDPEEVSSPGRV